MNKILFSTMRVTMIGALALIIQTTEAQAGDGKWTCTSGKLTRTIEVVEKEPGKKAPCEVKYTNEKGDSSAKWSAQNDSNYCTEKAKGFSEKLGGMGWKCD